jgi:hypothetical protein
MSVDTATIPASGVKGTLTADRPQPVRRRRARRHVETREFGAMVARMIRAYGRRVADADPEDLADLVAMRSQLDDAISVAVGNLRAHHGFTWASIGDALGCSKQAAQQRYGRTGTTAGGVPRND